MKSKTNIYIFFILIFSIFIYINQGTPKNTKLTNEVFFDGFEDGYINSSIWTSFHDDGVGIEESGGSLNGVITKLNSSGSGNEYWLASGMSKSFDSSKKLIELDFNFKFSYGMGRLYIVGLNNSNRVWLAGFSDGWSGSNARPIIYGYDSDGIYDPAISWNTQDITTNKMATSGGSAHLTVEFKTQTEVEFNMTFPVLVNGQTEVSFSISTSAITDEIQLLFGFPPQTYYDANSNWSFDNYIESSELNYTLPTPPQTEEFLEEFDDGYLDTSIWQTFGDGGVSIEESQGTLHEKITQLNSSGTSGAYWLVSGISKKISASIQHLELDFSFDFKQGMGRIYLIGLNDTNRLWIAGLSDGWSGSNARPIVHGYSEAGPTDNSISWNTEDLTTNKITNSGGFAHLRVDFTSPKSLDFSFAFPTMIDGVGYITHSMSIVDQTTQIQLLFSFPPVSYYGSSSFWRFDNYYESNAISSKLPTPALKGLHNETFDDSYLNTSVWRYSGDGGVGIQEYSGTLNGIVSQLNDQGSSTHYWKYNRISKNLDPNTKHIELDYSFDFFNGMGRLYMVGVNHDETLNRWLVGFSDGWSGSNARPIISGYDSAGNVDPRNSFNRVDLTTNKMTSSGGYGTVAIDFLTPTRLKFTFYFPVLINGQSNVTHTMNLPGVTDKVQLYFGYPPQTYYAPASYWNFDNYLETNTISSNQTDTVTLSTTTQTTITTEPDISSSMVTSDRNSRGSETDSSSINSNNQIQTTEISSVMVLLGMVSITFIRKKKT